jgi:hypothetical protein
MATQNKAFKLSDVKIILQALIGHISAEKWAHCNRHVMEDEEESYSVN